MDYVRRFSPALLAGYFLCAAVAIIVTGCGGDGGGSMSSGTPPPGAPQGIAVPSITGTPATTVVAGSQYSFRPSASDTKGYALTFSIENMPSWATFDATTGVLSGTPSASNVGHFQSITISVSNGQAMAQLASFSIEVTAAPPTIAAFQGTSGPVGTKVIIAGTNLTGTTSVKFNGKPVTIVTVLSDQFVQATVPAGATTGVITLTTAAGTATSAGKFTVTP